MFELKGSALAAGDEREAKDRRLFWAGAGALACGGVMWAWRKLGWELMFAPGWPGKAPQWTSSAKQGVGASAGLRSRLWFTLCRGIVTEVFSPRADQPAVARMGLIITADDGFYCEEESDARHEIAYVHGVPLYCLMNIYDRGRCRIEKTIFAHPSLPVLLQKIRFTPLEGRLEEYRAHVLINPHLGNRGWRNRAWIVNGRRDAMLFAEEDGHSLAVGAQASFRKTSAGFAGKSDGRRQLHRHGRLVQTYRSAPRGDVSLIAELDLEASGGETVIALGIGAAPEEAAVFVRRALQADWDDLKDEFFQQWLAWQNQLDSTRFCRSPRRDLFRTSTMVLKTHEDKTLPGAFVASLSIPWGQARRTDDHFGPVGYHVVWPRDLYMIAGGLLAAGDGEAARRALEYCQATQRPDGSWPQNQAVNGASVWTGKQLGETSLPVLLLDLANRAGLLTSDDRRRFWPMARAAVGHIVRNGPSAQEDRWENARGFTPFTLSDMIAALVIAAEFADEQHERELADFLRVAADAWFGDIDYWTYVHDTSLAHRFGVKGYYLRVAPPDDDGRPIKYRGQAELWYRPRRDELRPPAEIVSVDALAYVRFGLRAADDPRILDTLKLIDALLKVETQFGPCWRRYYLDGYGEQQDGSAFDGKRGIGRLWPLLTGERAHYELLAGRPHEAERLLAAMEGFAGDGGMLPEQIWDSKDIPSRGLYFGRPSGSAMPLAWAHAEYLKLRRSLAEGCVYDQPLQTRQRYLVEKTEPTHVLWRPSHRRRIIPAGRTLRIVTDRPATIHYEMGGSPLKGRLEAHEAPLGVYYADLPTGELPPSAVVRFRFERAQVRFAKLLEPHVVRCEEVRIETNEQMMQQKVV